MKQNRLASPGVCRHFVYEADARDLSFIETESAHLVCTSPPYASLVRYPERAGQLGNVASYEQFLGDLDLVWAECLRILVPGGRVTCVVGDVCISRRKGGRHYVLPLAADLQVRARRLGFDNLTPILWHKVANIRLEASRSARYWEAQPAERGRQERHRAYPVLPQARRVPKAHGGDGASLVDRDRELQEMVCTHLVGYHRPGSARSSSALPAGSAAPAHPNVQFRWRYRVDPFAGTGTTAVAAFETGRNSISIDVEPGYVHLIEERLMSFGNLTARIEVHRKPAPSERLRTFNAVA